MQTMSMQLHAGQLWSLHRYFSACYGSTPIAAIRCRSPQHTLSLQALAQALGGSVGPNPDGNFVLTIEQVTPTQQLSQFKQLEAAIKAALESTVAAVASPPVDAPAPERAAAARAAAVTAAGSSTSSSNSSSSGSAGDGSGSNGSSSSSDALVQQLGDLSVRRSPGSSGGSSAPCSSGGCFHLIESHGDQVCVWLCVCGCGLCPAVPASCQRSKACTAQHVTWHACLQSGPLETDNQHLAGCASHSAPPAPAWPVCCCLLLTGRF